MGADKTIRGDAFGPHVARVGRAQQAARSTVGLLGATVVLVVVALGGCRREDAEESVRKELAAMQAAVEARQLQGLLAPLADDFIGEHGLDRDGVKRLAAGAFLRHQRVHVLVGPVATEKAAGGQVRASFRVVLTGSAGGLLPVEGNAYRVETAWRQQGGDWVLHAASWRAQGE